MEENKRLIIVGSIIVLLFGLLIAVYAFDKGGVKNYSTTSSNGNYELYYLGREGCGYCQMFQPNIDYIKETYGVNYKYIDIEKITNTELSEYLSKFHVDSSKFGTPTIAIMKNGEYVANSIGYLSKQELYNFLKKNNVITGEYKTQYTNLTYIDLDDYKEIVNSNDKQIVVIAQDDCSGCEELQKYLNSFANSTKTKVNFYNVTFETEEDYDYFYKSYDYIKNALDEEELYTPTILVVENKNVIDSLSQYESDEKVSEFLKKNGYIK